MIGSVNATRAPRRPGGRRRWTIAATVGGVALVIWVAGLPLYVFPPVDDPPQRGERHAEVAFVIGPPTEERIAQAEALQDAGKVDAILISVPAEGEQSGENLRVCSEPNVTCATPSPATTTGEASLLDDYSADHPADSVIVITFTPHVVRTRFIFERCYVGETIVVASPTRLDLLEWVYQYAYQSAAFVKAAVWSCIDTRFAR